MGVTKLEKSYGGRTLFEDVSLQLNPGCRYGLVGANGSGKSTFLRILAGDEPASDGTVNIAKGTRLGVLRQDRFLAEDANVVDLAMQGDDEVTLAAQERDRLLEQGDALGASEIDERLRVLGASTLRSRAGSILAGLGIPVAQHEKPLRQLSGGMKLRVLLAQVLVGRPDVLLLDEPTNHLDILSIRWLERFLQGFEGCCVVISHDQRFLDNVATHVLDVDFEDIWLYKGNYTVFERDKAAIIERKEAENARIEEIIAEKKAFIERFRAKATKARQAQSRMKQLEKIEVEEIKPTSRREPRIRFVPERASGRDVLGSEGIAKSYGPKRVLTGVDLTVRRGERIGVIGANGLGKSTLLRILAGKLERDAGKITWGHEVKIGYFPQDHKELFPNPKRTVLDYLWDLCPLEGTSFVRGELGRALFSGDDVEKNIETLSGGEAARLLFARLSVEKPNVLLLDEPTNHLDMEAIHALAKAVKAFEGTVLFVSHNRWFVSELASRIVEIREDGIVDFPGTYDEYLAKCGDDHLDTSAVLAKKKAADAAASSGSKTDLGWEETKKKRNRLKVLKDKSEKITASIEVAEQRVAAIKASYCEDGFFERTSSTEVEKLHAEEQSLGAKVEAMLAEWEAVETELGELKAALGES
ncbi:MAG: ABC-F family ATP-binding cassette domain-containing protein [Polyangiaceae bacterium]|nr:ABC-F family ATP-binding cassette domain-containing protein [Polyangiaceae bacterium]